MSRSYPHAGKHPAELGSVEKLLRRAAGSITAYMDTVGERPLRISDFDKAVLAIRDGELEAFKDQNRGQRRQRRELAARQRSQRRSGR